MHNGYMFIAEPQDDDEEPYEPTDEGPRYAKGNYPCDGPDPFCPFFALYIRDCEWFCGLGL